MGAMAWEPQRMKPWHEQVADFIIAQPQASLKDVAAFFEVTPTFIYMLTGSDMFRAHLRKKQDAVSQGIIFDTKEKLQGLCHMAIDDIAERLAAKTASERLVTDTFSRTLSALGFDGGGGAAVGGGNTHIQVVVGAQALVDAREKAATAFAGQAELKKDGETIIATEDEDGVAA